MKKLFLVLLSALALPACTKSSIPQKSGKEFKVVGYLHSNTQLKTDFQQIDLAQVTDINIAFVNPDSDGNFNAQPAFKEVIAEAHRKQVKVFFSLGGGAPPAHLETLLATAEGRATLIRGIVNLLETYNFDGVDIDLENDLINEHYSPFVSAVSQAVKAKKKTISAALASWNANKIADSTLAQYDFIHVMSYDATGPWNPQKAGPHSPYSMAVNDFNYFTQVRKVPAARITVGLPFYGYGFNGAPVSMKFKDIIREYPGSEKKDEITIGSGTLYYNGIPTIENKTRFAREQGAAGVMIWQLLQDTQEEYSLLKAINRIAYPSN